MGGSTNGSEWISAAGFHRAPGVTDWRVTGTGPRAVFTATSFAHAAGLVGPVAAAAERLGGRTHVDVFAPADLARARVEGRHAEGGRLADDSHAPAWWSLASPDTHGVVIADWTDTDD